MIFQGEDKLDRSILNSSKLKTGDFVVVTTVDSIGHLNLFQDIAEDNDASKIIIGVVVNDSILLETGTRIFISDINFDNATIQGSFCKILYVLHSVNGGFSEARFCFRRFLSYGFSAIPDCSWDVIYINPNLPHIMTIEEIEKALGYKIIIKNF